MVVLAALIGAVSAAVMIWITRRTVRSERLATAAEVDPEIEIVVERVNERDQRQRPVDTEQRDVEVGHDSDS